MLSHERVRSVVLDLDDFPSSCRLDLFFDWSAKRLDTVLDVREHGFQLG